MVVLKRNENVCLHKDFHMIHTTPVTDSIISLYKKLKQFKCSSTDNGYTKCDESICWDMIKQLRGMKYSTRIILKHTMLNEKKTYAKVYILQVSLHLKCSEKANL